MGARKSHALTEQEVAQIRVILLNLRNNAKIKNEGSNNFYKLNAVFMFELLVKTGIRISDYAHLVDAWNKKNIVWLDVFIPKQSNRAGSSKTVKRIIKLPKMVFEALIQKEFNFPATSTSNVKQWVKFINDEATKHGISRNISPHDLRATFINMLKHRGYDIWDVKSITMHSNIESLIAYFSKDADTIHQAYESLEHDRYNANNPQLLIKENNRLKDENAILRAELQKFKEMR